MIDIDKYRSIGGIVKGGTPRFHDSVRGHLLSQCKDKTSPISTMMKDKIMFKNINKNGSDKHLKKDAEAIQTKRHEENKKKEHKRIWAKADASLERYRKRYHTDPL